MRRGDCDGVAVKALAIGRRNRVVHQVYSSIWQGPTVNIGVVVGDVGGLAKSCTRVGLTIEYLLHGPHVM